MLNQQGGNQTTHLRYYRRQEAAELLCVCPKTLDKYIRRGDLTVHKLGRRVLISASDLVQFVERHTSIAGGGQ